MGICKESKPWWGIRRGSRPCRMFGGTEWRLGSERGRRRRGVGLVFARAGQGEENRNVDKFHSRRLAIGRGLNGER